MISVSCSWHVDHILEIIAATVFEQFLQSSGPQIAVFSRFKEQWPCIAQKTFAAIDKHTTGCILTTEEKKWRDEQFEEVVRFLCKQLKQEIQPRQDYAEFIDLALITLGVVGNEKSGTVKFRPPGAYYRARWMVKFIYCLKIVYFRE